MIAHGDDICPQITVNKLFMNLYDDHNVTVLLLLIPRTRITGLQHYYCKKERKNRDCRRPTGRRNDCVVNL